MTVVVVGCPWPAITLRVPALRERIEDVLPMARHYLRFFEQRQGRQDLSFSPECERAIVAHPWPGNLRELRNAIEGAVILCPASVLGPGDLGLTAGRVRGLGVAAELNACSATRVQRGAEVSLGELEREHIARVVARAPSFETAARILGIDITTLQRKRKRYGLA